MSDARFRLIEGAYYDTADGSGPYAIDDGVQVIMGGDAVAVMREADRAVYVRRAGGYYSLRDGTGPYSIDSAGTIRIVGATRTEGETWATLPGRPAVVAGGDTKEEAREAIGAGTSNLVLGTTADKAAAGNHSHDGLMTQAERDKLNGVEAGANAYVLPAGQRGQVLKHNGTDWAAGTDSDTTYGEATSQAAGLMSASDKAKLNGIEANANAFVLPTGLLGQVLKVTEQGWQPADDKDTTYQVATVSANGLMPASAVEKLAGIQEGANKTELGTTQGKAKPGDWLPSWNDVQSKPASFTAAAHGHGVSDLSVSDTIKSILSSNSVADVRTKLNIVNPANSFTTTTTLYSGTAEIAEAKIFTAIVSTTTAGQWSVNYAHVGFQEIFSVNAVGEAIGTALGDRTIACVGQGMPTLTACSGYLMSASSAGLLAAMTLVNGSGKVHVTVYGR